MKSNICVISDKAPFNRNVLDEVEKVAQYNRLSDKETLRLRLLTEEMIGMIPNLSEGYTGEFWAETENNHYELHVTLEMSHPDMEASDRFLAVSSSGKNAAAKGIIGKIRVAVAAMAAYSLEGGMMPEAGEGVPCMNPYACYWSLSQYTENVKNEKDRSKQEEAWDELEKSVIANLADDVVVGISGKKITLTIHKNF